MKIRDALKSIILSIIRTSILLGALFFCQQGIRATTNTFILPDDSAALMRADSIRAKKITLSDRDTLQEKDTAQFPIHNIEEKQEDVIYTPTEKDVKRMFADHSPPRATIFSAVLPGLGQAYNRKYWKIPIIYLAGYTLYSGWGGDWGWKYFHEQYKDWKKLYEEEYYKPDKNKDLEDIYKKNMNIASKYRGRFTIALAILYAANIVDAMADAHFYYFDIGDDLSLRILPDISVPDPYVAMTDYSLGLKLRINF